MNLVRLYIYPIAIALLIVVLVFVPYGISIYNEHLDPFLPYTTDTGVLAIESGFFAQILLIIALLFAILAYLQYLQLSTYYTLSERSESLFQLQPSIVKNKKKILKINRSALYVAIYIVVIITSIVSFRANEFPIFHPIVCITFFIAVIVFVAMKSWLSLKLSPQINSKPLAQTRIILTVLLLLSFIIALVCGIWSFSETNHTSHKQRLHWNSKDDGYTLHIISAISQWVFVLLLVPFIASYFKEMKSMSIHNGVLRITFTTTTKSLAGTVTTTVKTNTKTKKSKNSQTKM